MTAADISIVVATRNRPQALEMSLPLMLAQTLPPREIVIVDSSDDPNPVRNLVKFLAAQTDIPIEYVISEAGLTKQRNVGLARISAPIVAFPDDDSLLYPTYLEEIERVYAADANGVLVGVTVNAARRSPLVSAATGSEERPVETYAPKSSGRVMDAFGKLAVGLKRRVVQPPYTYLRAEIRQSKTLPDAIKALGCSLVVTQEGFRMSFRTRPLREARFNECMTGYCLGEDIDVSFGLASKGMMVRLNKPLIFHHEFPGTRAGGYRRGVMQIINPAYIIARHTDADHAARTAFGPWIWFLIAQILPRIGSAYERDRLRGVWTGFRHLGPLLAAPRQQADEIYLRIMGEI